MPKLAAVHIMVEYVAIIAVMGPLYLLYAGILILPYVIRLINIYVIPNMIV